MDIRKSIKAVFLITLITAVLSITSCYCDSSDDDVSSTGSLNLSITDAPVDDASVVNLRFDSLTFKHRYRSAKTITDLVFNDINLLDYTGGVSRLLLQTDGNQEIALATGEYNWIRFDVSAAIDDVYDSYITISGQQYELEISSETGLKLNTGFTVPTEGTANFTVDFDLRHSIIGPFTSDSRTYYKLKPVLRLLDDTTVGTLTGIIDSGLLSACDAPSVYLFEGELEEDALDDMDFDVAETDSYDNVEPISTVSIPENGGGDYTYTIGFIEEGQYTAAYSCDEDDPNIDDDDEVSFAWINTVTIAASETTVHHFSGL